MSFHYHFLLLHNHNQYPKLLSSHIQQIHLRLEDYPKDEVKN
uniref:Uncharacterized protein n=1 Tax=virus sp. ctML55 TaxID=2827627 RepID=A0A8S5RHZ3_9VIRU|nr:MAG TPA: hypothetical protein [virus sp. ctML55]DAX00431.1 MAG TPA: hypothetical protein [Bacteriophage sp.]